VAVDVQVALGLDGQVEQAVLGELVQHVVEEPDAGGDVRLAGAVEVYLDQDAGLARGALDSADPAHKDAPFPRLLRPAEPSIAFKNAVVSSGVPALTRSMPGRPMSGPAPTAAAHQPASAHATHGLEPDLPAWATISRTA